jgi:hypothetical protein
MAFRSILAVALFWAASLIALSALSRAADPFLGTFENDEGKIVVRSAGEGLYEGEVTLEGYTFKFTGQRRGETLHGKLKVEEAEFAFTATVSGDTLTISSDGETHVLKRKGGPAGAENPWAKAKEGAKAKAGWKIYRHPLGLSFGYPADWTLKPLDEGILQLVPAGAAEGEVILVAGVPAEGITDPKDPRVTAGTDQLIATEVSPMLKRKGGAQPAKDAHGRGITLLYEGPGASGGTIQARIYTTILKEYSVGMLALMTPDKLKAREADLAKVFATFRAGQTEIDQRLVGQWTFMSETVLDAQSAGGRKPGDASLVGNHQRTATLNADGSLTLRTVSHSIASGAGVFLENKSDETERGSWAAGEGKLILVWEDGSGGEYRYQLVDGGARLIIEGEGRRVEWQRG